MFDPWVRKIPWRRERLPTPVFFPGEFHAHRSLASYSPWGCKESDTTEQLTLSLRIRPWTTCSGSCVLLLCDAERLWCCCGSSRSETPWVSSGVQDQAESMWPSCPGSPGLSQSFQARLTAPHKKAFSSVQLLSHV